MMEFKKRRIKPVVAFGVVYFPAENIEFFGAAPRQLRVQAGWWEFDIIGNTPKESSDE